MITDGINEILLEILIAVALILAGIFFGKILAYGLKKVVRKTDIDKEIRPSFVNLIITVIKWSIYIGFFNIALMRVPIPMLNETVTRILPIIPALTASLVIIGVGFAIAIYLKNVIEDSEITEWETLSLYLYYFVLYIAGVFALNLALIPFGEYLRGGIIIALTLVVGGAIAFGEAKRKHREH